jgi:hypothetical protein
VEQLIVLIFRNIHGRYKFANKVARSCSRNVSKILHTRVLYVTGEATSASKNNKHVVVEMLKDSGRQVYQSRLTKSNVAIDNSEGTRETMLLVSGNTKLNTGPKHTKS